MNGRADALARELKTRNYIFFPYRSDMDRKNGKLADVTNTLSSLNGQQTKKRWNRLFLKKKEKDRTGFFRTC